MSLKNITGRFWQSADAWSYLFRSGIRSFICCSQQHFLKRLSILLTNMKQFTHELH